MISKSFNGGPADKKSDPAMMAADGRHVAFWSGASNLIRRDTNRRPDLFVHDRVSGKTVRATVSTTGEEAKLPLSGFIARGASISANGRRVAFMSRAANLVPGDTNRRADIFVRDLDSHQTTRVNVTSSGEQVCESQAERYYMCASGAWISGDGQRVVFLSDMGDLVADDSNSGTDVFLHDLGTRETTRVSVDPSRRSDLRTPARATPSVQLLALDLRRRAVCSVHVRGRGCCSGRHKRCARRIRPRAAVDARHAAARA